MTNSPAILFCPADRPERYAKAAAAADSVIVDLEDAVATDRRAEARRALVASDLDPTTTIVRVNAADTDDHALDVEALASTSITTVMLAKTESAAQIDTLADRGYRVIALCETAPGVLEADAIARHPATEALMWGAEDLLVSLGGRSSRFSDGRYRDVVVAARSRILLAAGAAGKPAIDAVFMDIADLDGLRAEAEDAAASGFWAKACIHPTQASVVRSAFAPTADDVAWARGVLAAARDEPGAFRHDGRMIDEPILAHARRLIEASEA